MPVLSATFRAIDEMSAVLDRMANYGETVITQWESAGNTVSVAFEQTVSSADDAVQAITSATDTFEESLEAQTIAADNAANSIENYGDIADEAGGQSEQFGNTSVNAVQELSKALTAAGIAKLLNEIYEGFAAAASAAIEFESAITGVYKTVDGTDAQLAAINSEIKAMALNMPASTTEIAGVAEAAGQLGIATEDITYFTEVMINLGEATNLSADEAATALAKFSNITGMVAADYESLGSTVVALGNNFATTEADIVAMSTRMASAGTLAGLTEPEILALAASMSSVGIEADAGGSAMSKLLTDIQVAVETGSDRLEDFADVAGMTGEQFADAFGDSAASALYSFIDGLNDVERNGETATVILENMGLTEVRLSNAVKSLASNSMGLASAIDVANSAWEINTALATEADLRYSTLESRLAMAENAANNVAIAIGDDLTPAIGGFVDAGISVLEWTAGFIEDHPGVTAALTGIAVGTVAMTGALAAYSAVQAVATRGTIAHTVAQAALNLVMNANPVFLTITGVVALTAAVAAFVAVLSSQKTEYETWTASTRKQYDELEKLNSEYEEACTQYGETSERALELRYQVDELTESFEANKQTLEQFIAETDALIEQHHKTLDGYEKNTAAIKHEEQGALALIYKLEQLGQKTSLTATEQEQMRAIVDSLNETVPDLALNYDDVTNSLDATADALERTVRAQAEQELLAEQHRTWVDLTKQEVLLQDQLMQAEENLALRRQELTGEGYNVDSPFIGWSTNLDDYQDEVERLTVAYAQNEEALAQVTAQAEAYQKQLEEAANATVDSETAVSRAISSVSDEINALAVAYDEAYEAALSSVQGQYSLWDEAEKVVAKSAGSINSALESQITYWQDYNANLSGLTDRSQDIEGLNEMLASFADGSADSVNAVAGMATATDKDLAAMVDSWQTLQEEQKTVADSLAELETDFATKMDEIEGKMVETIEKMNMEDDAATQAKATIDAYIKAIEEGVGRAETAAQAVASATTRALGGGNVSVGVTGYASGTTSAERGVKLVGEEGPELVLFDGGETVIDADNTDRILSSTAQRPLNVQPPAGFDTEERGHSSTSEKKITLEINGSGAIPIDRNVDKEHILDVLIDNIRPILINVLQQDVFEEGDLSYEF